MEAMSNIPSKGTKKRVVIVGGGFGGLKLARRLNDRDFQVILLDRNNYHLFQPLLYQVATSGIEPSAISFPFRKIFKRRHDFHVRICTAERVIPQENRLETSIGDVSYDYLVIATGAGTNYFGDQTLAQRTMQLKTTSDALFNRNRMIESFERALNTSDAEERRHWLTFVIVGGGATGIELAGALAEMRKFVLPKDYPELDWNEMRILLVDGGERLLNAFSGKSSEDVIRNLKNMKVEVLLKKLVKEYDGKKLTFVDGEQVVTNNVFWVAGVKANSLEGLPQDVYGRGNRLLVDEFNRVQGMADIFALGDTALMVAENYPNGHPQVVQPSIQQASLLAKNLRHMIKGKPLRPFKYMNKGSMATIGRNDAVAEISGIRFSGFFAWLPRLETSIGDVSYDYLVIATGAGTNYFGDQTLAQRTMQLKTTSDALFNRNRMIESFERALNTSDAEERRHWLTFVIVGGGATGIELAGALAEMRKFVLPKDYPELDWNEMRILLVDGGERLLNAFSGKSSEDVIRNLKNMKVEVLLKKLVKEYDGKKLTFVDGEQVVTNNVFWVAGVKANSLEGLPQDVYGRGNRLLVDEFNRVQGMADIFALGDTALMVAENYPNGHPQVVQPSIQQASLLAKNLRHMIKGKPLRPFKYMNKGSMATIGRNDAVAEISGIRFSGFFAWLLWLLVHLMSIVGVKNRLFIFINWMWSYVTYDQSLRLLIKPEVKKSDPF